MDKFNLVCDVDGILTTGEHFYSENGKQFKSFGSNEKDALNILAQELNKIVLCSADSVGQEVNKSRLSEFGMEYVYCSVHDRQNLVNSLLPCIYIGDGVLEPNATINICLSDSTPQAIKQADVILPTTAGKNVFPHLLEWFSKQNILEFANNIKKALNNGGKIILTGVGKNFSLAQLVSEFFLPYNLIAVPLDANHSLHGSLGIICENDVLIASSKSGDTEELVAMMRALESKFDHFENNFLITSNPNSKCAYFFKHVLVLDALKEESLHGFSPQSTISQYLRVYFQILNIINKNNECTELDYLVNHHGGTIGKNL